jgi:hypothetical protein
MKLCFLLFLVLPLPVSGETLTGTIEKIGKNQLQIRNQDGLVTVQTDEKTTVRKTKTFHDLSPLAAGDEVRVTYYGEGTFTAVNISVRVTLSGVITESNPSHIMVVPASTDQKGGTFVFLHPDTKFGTDRKYLTIGRRVHVVGWDVSDQVVDADRVAIYESDLPARTAPSRPR